MLRLRVSKSAVGISLKTQELFLIVFVTRYLDLFTTFYSVYNSVMKIAYIASTALIIYMIRFKEPYKSKYDKFPRSEPRLAFFWCRKLRKKETLARAKLAPLFLRALAQVAGLVSALQVRGGAVRCSGGCLVPREAKARVFISRYARQTTRARRPRMYLSAHTQARDFANRHAVDFFHLS